MNSIAIFFKKNKIRKKKFKKKTQLIRIFTNLKKNFLFKKNTLKRGFFYKKYTQQRGIKFLKKTQSKKNPTLVLISQKKFNPRGSIFIKRVLNTFSVGSIIKYFKVKQTKHLRRSLKGLKIFLNFLKNSFERFYLNQKKSNYLVISISGVDYNLVNLKKNIKHLIRFNGDNLLFLLNLKISFTKKKDKKVKAIKKRLKKKIILNFIKNTV